MERKIEAKMDKNEQTERMLAAQRLEIEIERERERERERRREGGREGESWQRSNQRWSNLKSWTRNGERENADKIFTFTVKKFNQIRWVK